MFFFSKKSIYADSLAFSNPNFYFNIKNEAKEEGVELIKKKRLKKITIDSDEIFKLIENIECIEDINILGSSIRDFFPIHSLKNLKQISIEKPVNHEIYFNFFPKLEHCYLNWSDYTKGILDVPTLKSLRLLKYTETDFTAFKNLSNLRFLELDKSRVSNTKGLSNLKQLGKLDLFGSIEITDLEGIEFCTQIENLRLEACYGLSSMEYIADIPNLISLDFSNIKEIDTIMPLKRAHNLVEISFGEKTNITDGNLSCLKELYDKYNLNWAIYMNRKHYTHQREEFNKDGDRMAYIKALHAKYLI